jgi:murein DD-endopeptidase MepM/ murein hydrolase activator NlpD
MIYRRNAVPFILLAVLLCLFSYNSFAQNQEHLVVRGDTIYSISRLYKVGQEELMRHNGLADASKLQAGMRLVIPSATSVATTTPTTSSTATTTTVSNPPATVASTSYTEYTVSKNDTLYSIARIRGVTLQALRDINGFSKNYVLKAGEKIKIPVPAVIVDVTPNLKPPASTTPKKVDPSIRWPIAAKEILYMSNNVGVLVSGMEFESIKSLTGGTVVHASPWRGYGNVAVIESAGGYRYLYGACETLSVKKGDSIEPGTELGKLGIYPASGKPDLVFMVSQNGSPVDPAKAPRF